MNWKALLAGSATIIFLGLLLQLIFLLAATGYTVVIREHPQWQTFGTVLAYALGILGYFIIMSIGGYIAANIARRHVYRHAILIGAMTTGLSLISSIQAGNITLTSISFVVAGIGFTMIGAYFWLQTHKTESTSNTPLEST